MKTTKRMPLLIGILLTVFVLFISCTSKSTADKSAGGKTNETQQVIKVGSSGGYFPFTFMKDDKLQGFEIDVWNEIGKRAGYKIDFVTAGFSGLFGMLDTGKIDTIANQITITDQRKQKYLFASPYVYTGAQLVVKKGNDKITKLEDLKGKKVGVDLGSNYEQIMRKYDTKNEINIITYQGSGATQDVMLGRIDALMIDKVSALASIQDQNLDLQIAGNIVEPIENAFPFVNNDKNKATLVKVDKAISDMKADGTLEKISNKWVKTDITNK